MDELFAKGPQAAVKILKEEQGTERGKRRLRNLFTILLNPDNVFNEETATWCFSLLSGGKNLDDYFKLLKTYDNSPVCGLVWNANFFAYRCRDCGISPCMSLCADCFLAGNHRGHDFNMFKSQAGGACDCGDDTVMRKEGFCHLHGHNSQTNRPALPKEIIDLPKQVLPELVICLYEKVKLHFDQDKGTADALAKCVVEVEHLLKVLNRSAEVEALREIVCEKILCTIESLASSSAVPGPSTELSVGTSAGFPTSMVSCEASNGRKIVRTASTETITSIEITMSNAGSFLEGPRKPFVEETEQGSLLKQEGQKQTYLQFFMEVLVKTEFPSVLATFLLQLLPNQNYKETFTRLFCRQYTAIGKSLSSSTDPDILSNHMVHVSVQLFSNENLALKMVKEENLLFKMIFVLSKMIGECLDNFSLEVEGHEVSIMAVNCNNKLLKSHCYWPIASDLTNILSHQSVARIFLETGDCLSRWMHFVAMLTGMNMNNRRMMSYVEYDPKHYYTAFSMEFESVAAVMWELYRAVIKMNDKVHALKMIEVSAAALKDWYSFVPCKLKKCSFTFHLSLHRYFALFVSQAVNHFNEDLLRVIPVNIVWDTLEYLVNALVSLQEIRAGFWLYNGHQMTCQAQSYLQSYFCNSMFDLDVFFLQITASLIDADIFLGVLIERFSIYKWFQFGDEDEESKSSDDVDKTVLLVEGFLNTLLMILTHRVYSGSTEKEIQQKDIVANLCLADRTHSQLVDIIPTRPGDTHSPGKFFDEILCSVSDYKEPAVELTGLQQGIYTPKANVWMTEFDFNHIHSRVYKKSDQQSALDRYNEAMQRYGCTTSASVWPPLRDLQPVSPAFQNLFRLLQSRTLHQMLIFILQKMVNDFNSVPEPVLIATVHLLQLSLDHADIKIEPGLEKEFSNDDFVMELAIKYLDSAEEARPEILVKLKKALSNCDELKIMLSSSPDEDITFILEAKFHSVIFKSLCQYMDTVLDQENEKSSSAIQHLRTLVLLLSDKQQQLLKKLVYYWSILCDGDKEKIMLLPFLSRRGDGRTFGLVLTLLIRHFDYVFQVRSRIPGYPSHAFDLNLPHRSLRENLCTQIFDEESKHSDVDHFIEITQCQKEDALEYLKVSNGDLQEALTLFLNASPTIRGFVPISSATSLSSSSTLSSSSSSSSLACSSSSLFPSSALSSSSSTSSTSAGGTVSSTGRSPLSSQKMVPDETSCYKANPCSSKLENEEDSRSSVDVADLLSDRCSVCSTQWNDISNCSLWTILIHLRTALLSHSNSSPMKMKKEVKIVAGDGVFYIEKLLLKYYSISEEATSLLLKLCPELVPQNSENSSEVSTSLEAQEKAKKERRKKAAERQKQLLEEFASKQMKFMESTEMSSMDISEDSNDSFTSHCKECVICGQVTESTEERPIGLILYMHPSTVLGKRKMPQSSSQDSSSKPTGSILLCEDIVKPRRELLSGMFESRSVRAAFECGVDCGINIQSCGHHVHIDCQQAYFKTLQDDHTILFNIEKGEFSCPLCRQLSNGVMPLIPVAIKSSSYKEIKEPITLKDKCEQISTFLSHLQQGGLSPFTARALVHTVLTASMTTLNNTIEELLKCGSADVVEFYVGEKWRFSDSFFTLLASLRHNIEMEHMTSYDLTSLSSSVKNCLREVLEAFHFRCQSLSSPMCVRWQQLCYPEEQHSDQKSGKDRSFAMHFEVPVLLCDPVSLLLQFFLSWPQNMSPGELKCLIQLIYNLSYMQALVTVGSKLQVQEKESWFSNSDRTLTPLSLSAMASTVWMNTSMFENADIAERSIEITHNVVSEQTIELQIQELCLPFMKFSAVLLRVWLSRRGSLPDEDFTSLSAYLCLGDADQSSEVTTTRNLRWPTDDPTTLVTCWCTNLSKKMKNIDKPKDLLPVATSWLPPTLIELPHLFDSLFQKYRKRKCNRCQKPPDDPTLCLVCGEFLCFHGNCCRIDNVSECVQHSIDCGCGTGIILVVSSSVTLVIRDERVCLWGSVYLDNFGEEDRDLRRGKPLYLSEERYARLQDEWRNHVLDKSCKRWGVHLNNL